jgi:hypothetical protein
VRLDTFISIFTLVKLKIVRMVLELLPSMSMLASVLVLAAISVVINKLLGAPVATLFFSIDIKLRFPPEILPIMCINALISLVLSFIIRAPYSFKMEHIEVRVFWKFVN